MLEICSKSDCKTEGVWRLLSQWWKVCFQGFWWTCYVKGWKSVAVSLHSIDTSWNRRCTYRLTDILPQFSSVQFSSSVVSDSLRPHESQHARLPCPSPSPRVYSDLRPSNPWCHLILGGPLLLLPPIPPSIRVFSSESTLLMRWPKYWSFSFSIIPSKECQRTNWVGLATQYRKIELTWF